MHGVLRLHFLDSDCTIVEHPTGRVTMVDMGTTGRTDPADYYRQHFPTYWARRPWPHELFRFIATHPDMDHISGLATLIARVPLANFWYTAPNVEKEDLEDSPYDEEDWDTFQKLVRPASSPWSLSPKFGETGHFWTDDDIHIWAPWPEAEHHAETANKPNLASYILAIRRGSGLVVLGGDAPAIIWQRLLEAYRWLPKVAVLKAPHHGHTTDCYEPAVAAMHPHLTIITPDGDTEHDGTQLYQRHSNRVLRTDVHGNIVVTVWPDGTPTYESDLTRSLAPRPFARALASRLLAPPLLPPPLPPPSWPPPGP